jgi:outer membrane protein, multidrug efflux system
MIRKLLYRSLALFLPLLVFQCKMGPDFQHPTMLVESQYRMDSLQTDSISNLQWWEIFQDSTLIDLIELALVENKDLKVAAARIEESRAALGFSKADLGPALSYAGQAATSNIIFASMENAGDFRDIFYLAPVLSWELGFWGKVRRSNEAARNELFASEYGRRVLMMNLISDVASKYFLLLDLENRFQIAIRRAKSRKKAREIIEQRFEKGIVAELDVAQAKVQEATTLAMIPQFEREVVKAENALSILLGQNPGSLPEHKTLYDQEITLNLPVGLPSQLLERRPDIMQAEAMVASQNARIGAAQAMRLPTFNLLAILGVASNSLTSLFTSDAIVGTIMGQFTGPLFQFGKNKRRVEMEKKKTEAAVYNYENTALKAFSEVENALVSVKTYKKEHEARVYQMKAAEKATYLSTERYDKGATSFLEVLDSEKWLLLSELSESETRQLELNSMVLLFKALGGGWNAVRSPLPVDDKESIDYQDEDNEDGF